MEDAGLLQVDCTLKETVRVMAGRMGNAQMWKTFVNQPFLQDL